MSTRFIKIFKSYSRREQLVLFSALAVFVITSAFLSVDYIDRNTTLVPVAGGDYKEGMIGQPAFVNPVLVGASDPDRDLTEILFSNVLDMTQGYKVATDGKTWNLRLKEGIVWDDGQPITSDDVIFTIQSIQNPDSRSSLLSLWQGVQAERVSEREIKIVLPSPYVFFDDNLKELRPIPKHIFGSLPVANLRLSNYNLEPIGSGPFKFDSFKKRNDGFITRYNLVRNDKYFGARPYLDSFAVSFYEDAKKLLEAVNQGAVDGTGGLPYSALQEVMVRHQSFSFLLPKYYGIFFNSDANAVLAEKNVRLALSYAVDKNEIAEKVLLGGAAVVSGPLLPGMDGYSAKSSPKEEFSLERANQILDSSGWQMGADGVRVKDLSPSESAKGAKSKAVKPAPSRLEFTMVVPDTKFLVDAANLIVGYFSKIGVRLNLNVVASNDIENSALRNRNYEMLMFGNAFGNNSDLFSFWHSSESAYPGLNLALYSNQTADALIEATRKDFDLEARQIDFANLQSLIVGDAPAIFLFSPYYTYVAESSLGGLEEGFIPLASYRFQNIPGWYVRTARSFNR